MDLNCEYSLVREAVRVTQSAPRGSPMLSNPGEYGFLKFHPLENVRHLSGDETHKSDAVDTAGHELSNSTLQFDPRQSLPMTHSLTDFGINEPPWPGSLSLNGYTCVNDFTSQTLQYGANDPASSLLYPAPYSSSLTPQMAVFGDLFSKNVMLEDTGISRPEPTGLSQTSSLDPAPGYAQSESVLKINSEDLVDRSITIGHDLVDKQFQCPCGTIFDRQYALIVHKQLGKCIGALNTVAKKTVERRNPGGCPPDEEEQLLLPPQYCRFHGLPLRRTSAGWEEHLKSRWYPMSHLPVQIVLSEVLLEVAFKASVVDTASKLCFDGGKVCKAELVLDTKKLSSTQLYSFW